MERRDDEEQVYSIHDRRWWTQDDERASEEGAAERKPSYVEGLEAQLREKDEELRETLERAARAQNEFEQAKQRMQRESRRSLEQERRAFLRSFLDVLDDLDRAVDAAGEAEAETPLGQGVALVHQRFLGLLGSHGVTRLDAMGRPFDPQKHDALTTMPVEDPDKDGRVLEVIKPGYLIGEEVLRPASVVVGRHSSSGAAA